MREKTKRYPGIHFGIDTIRRAFRKFEGYTEKFDQKRIEFAFRLSKGDESWYCESFEEAAADYRKGETALQLSNYGAGAWRFEIQATAFDCHITIGAPERSKIDQLFEIFEADVENARPLAKPQPPKDPITVFIGHGHSNEWSKLMMHLQQHHGYKVEAYETGSRAGHAIRDILESMMEKSSLAILVMTGEDDMKDGELRARQNVVHEVGLFQGRLGFHRVLVLLENGCEKFSNLDGIQWIGFSKGNVREAFGDVLAAIKRETSIPSE